MPTRAPSTRVDAEELQSTRSERVLAVVLTIFLLVGTIWFYVKAADWIDDSPHPTTSQQRVLDARDTAWEQESEAATSLDSAHTTFDVAKANVDVATQGGGATPALTAAYTKAQAALTLAQAAHDQAQAAANAADKAASRVEHEVDEQHRSSGRAWALALLRLGFIVGWLAGSLALLSRLRKTRPRYLPLGFAAVITGSILALVFAIDYITDYIDPLELGPIVLSAIGVAATLAAFVALQRWLASRIPGRRVRKGECPYCGYPLHTGGSHCEGCGRETIAACATCHADRRVGSQHCVACGSA